MLNTNKEPSEADEKLHVMINANSEEAWRWTTTSSLTYTEYLDGRWLLAHNTSLLYQLMQ